MIGAQLGDRALVAALPFAEVIGHVRHEIGVAAVGFAHDAIFVVAVVGAAQPQRAAFFVGVAMADQFAHGLFDFAVGVERGFEVVHVERDPEGGEIEILFAAQIRDGETTDGVEVVGIARADHRDAIDVDRRAVEIGLRHVGDVVALIEIVGPTVVAGFQAFRAGLGRFRKILDLHPGIVVIELALDAPTVGIEHARDAIADRRGAAVADVQRAGGVGGDVFHARGTPGAAGVAAIGSPFLMNPAQLTLPRASS